MFSNITRYCPVEQMARDLQRRNYIVSVLIQNYRVWLRSVLPLVRQSFDLVMLVQSSSSQDKESFRAGGLEHGVWAGEGPGDTAACSQA